jgi:tRNA A-37 threonylcarbamoyl transferase component Bud32
MSACLTPVELGALASGTAPTEAQAQHVLGCQACHAALTVALQVTSPGPADGAADPAVAQVPEEAKGRYPRAAGSDGQPEVLGRGGFARVVLARDAVIGRDVAVKELRASRRRSPRGAVAEARLLQEARIVGQLEHQGIVPLHDVARSAEGHLFSVMRRIRGRTLAAAVREAGSLEARLRLLPHVLAACNAVAYAHSRGVVHRDLKPQNVMVDRYGETLVIDWGLARVRGTVELADLAPETSGALRIPDDSATLSDGQSRLGTPAYMSPEQLAGARALTDERSDVWGLGGILFEVLTGQPPRDSGAPEADPPKVRALVPQLPVDLAAICDKALEASRERRYASAEALAQDLDAWLHGDRVRAHEYRPTELLGRFVKQNRVAVTIGAAALVALLVVGVVAGLRVRAERNQTREFALLLSGDVLDRVRADVHDQLGTRLTERVSSWLRASPVEDDAVNAAWTWSRLVSEFEAADRVADARSAAQRCLELAPGGDAADPKLFAAHLTCRLTWINDRPEVPLAARHAQLASLWATLPATLPRSVELLLAAGELASRLSTQAGNLGQTADARRWAGEGERLAQQLLALAPDDERTWMALGAVHFDHFILSVNELDGSGAARRARALAEVARKGHALGRTPRSLVRLADALTYVCLAHRFFPEQLPEAEARAAASEAKGLFEAALLVDPGDLRTRRTYAYFLLDEGDAARGWALVAHQPRTFEFESVRTALYLGLLAGQHEWVLGQLATLPSKEASFDRELLHALALVQARRDGEAAAHLRAAAAFAFVSIWPVDAAPRWASAQAHPAAPALQVFAAALSQAQRANDGAAAGRALRAFADALERPAAP